MNLNIATCDTIMLITPLKNVLVLVSVTIWLFVFTKYIYCVISTTEIKERKNIKRFLNTCVPNYHILLDKIHMNNFKITEIFENLTFLISRNTFDIPRKIVECNHPGT